MQGEVSLLFGTLSSTSSFDQRETWRPEGRVVRVGEGVGEERVQARPTHLPR